MGKIAELNVVKKPIDSLIPHPKNPNTHSDSQIKKLAHSIKTHGFSKGSVVIQKSSGRIIAGHGIVMALKQLGYTDVDVIEADLLDGQAEAFMVSDNFVASQSVIDNIALQELINELSDMNIPALDFGFDNQDLEDLASQILADSGGYQADEKDDVIPEAKEAITKTGDLIFLGKHRLLCGDSTLKSDVDKLMGGVKAELCLTDPPYNIGFNYNEFSDTKSDNEYRTFCQKWFDIVKDFKLLIFTPGPRNEKYYPEPTDKGIWVKKNATAEASSFHLRLCEPILFYGKVKEKRNTDLFEYSTGFANELKEARCSSGVLDKHAPVKSIGLWAELLSLFPEGIIIDLFGGNGTTIIASEKLNRIAYLLEIDAHYCDVIVKRYIDFISSDKDVFVSRNGQKIAYKDVVLMPI